MNNNNGRNHFIVKNVIS